MADHVSEPVAVVSKPVRPWGPPRDTSGPRTRVYTLREENTPRPRWVRFAKAASTDISQDIYLTATARGLDVSFAPQSGSTDSWSGATPGSAYVATGDGSKTHVYCCMRGFLERLELAEADAGVVAMMAYGLMKASDLQVLPTTWRALLMAALRMAVLHGLRPESKATRAAEKLRTLVELWRPMWQRDYDLFSQRDHVGTLLTTALAATSKLWKAPEYKEADRAWDRKERALAHEDLVTTEAGSGSALVEDADSDDCWAAI